MYNIRFLELGSDRNLSRSKRWYISLLLYTVVYWVWSIWFTIFVTVTEKPVMLSCENYFTENRLFPSFMRFCESCQVQWYSWRFFCAKINPARVYESLYVLEASHCWLNRYSELVSKYQIFLCDISGVSIIGNNLIGAEWCCIVQEKPLSSRDILLENLRRNMNVRVFVYTWVRFEIRILLCWHLSPILNLGFCVDTYPMFEFCFLFFFVNSNHWCGGSSFRLLHELWKDPLLLLGYCRAREIWWSSRWILVSEDIFFSEYFDCWCFTLVLAIDLCMIFSI